MNFKNERIIAHLQKAIEQGHVLHGTWHPSKKLLPHQLRNLEQEENRLSLPYTYQEKAVHGTIHIPTAVIHAVLGTPYKRNGWGLAEVRKKTRSYLTICYSEPLQFRTGYILILPGKPYGLTRDRKLTRNRKTYRLTRDRKSLSSKLPLRVIESIQISPSIVRSWMSEGNVHTSKIQAG